MTFISYAQNREDVMLWRALGHIKNGFYIDVGANDPQQDSVTRAFYDRGWWGINIEPVPSLHARLQEQRARDINLGIAAGATDAELTLFDLPEVNGWATANPEVAAAHRADGHLVVESTVAVRRLADICAEHVRADIHFLKIDVEGFEEEVLRGMDLQRWRPWVVVVEATMPNSRDTNHAQWEELVTRHAYRFAYFDGLNRYYVAEEHGELMAALSIPPNVFDEYIPAQLDKAWAQLTHLDALQEDTQRKLHDATVHAATAEEQAAQALRDRVEGVAHAVAHAQSMAELAQTLEARAVRIEEEREALRTQLASIAAELGKLQGLYALEQEALFKANEAHAAAARWGCEMEQNFVAIRDSRWWRAIAPLRSVTATMRRVRPRAVARRLMLWAINQRHLRQLALRLVLRYPALGPTLRSAVSQVKRPPAPPTPAHYVPPPHLANLTVSARKVYADLAREHSHTPDNS